MEPEGVFDGRVIEDACVYHAGCAAVAFLGRLKCQADRAAQAVAVLVQDFSDAQQVGRMAVVAAGVHDAGDEGRVRTVVLFRQRQASMSARSKMTGPGWRRG